MTDTASILALQARFETEITVGMSIPTQWPNSGFTRPAGEWLRVDFIEGETRPIEMAGAGTVTERTPQIMRVSIFAPAGAGLARGREIHDAIALAFRRWRPGGGLRVKEVSGRSIGMSDKWWRWQSDIAFHHEEVGATAAT